MDTLDSSSQHHQRQMMSKEGSAFRPQFTNIRAKCEFDSIMSSEPTMDHDDTGVDCNGLDEPHSFASSEAAASLTDSMVIHTTDEDEEVSSSTGRTAGGGSLKKQRFAQVTHVYRIDQHRHDYKQTSGCYNTWSDTNNRALYQKLPPDPPSPTLSGRYEHELLQNKSEETIEEGVTTDDDHEAQLDQLTSMIFALRYLAEESEEKKHKDVERTKWQIADITNNSNVLVFNCAFDLEGLPNLTLLTVFCQRVFNWLHSGGNNSVLFHAEGHAATIRMLVLITALSNFYRASERGRLDINASLQSYLQMYPQSRLEGPVSWLKYSTCMQLVQTDSLVASIRSSVSIFRLTLTHYPVFQNNLLRLFFKFYSGRPLKHVYTSRIHTLHGTAAHPLVLDLSNCLLGDENEPSHELRLHSDVVLLAYHCPVYPEKRIRLFRLHFHTCQSTARTMTFHFCHFEEIRKEFDEKVQLTMNLSNGEDLSTDPQSIVRIDHGQVEQLPRSTTSSLSDLSSLAPTFDPDDASRMYDSLESLTLPRKRLASVDDGDTEDCRTIAFDSVDRLQLSPIFHDDLYSRYAQIVDRISCLDRQLNIESNETSNHNPIYQVTANKRNNEMPPPSTSQVPKTKKKKIDKFARSVRKLFMNVDRDEEQVPVVDSTPSSSSKDRQSIRWWKGGKKTSAGVRNEPTAVLGPPRKARKMSEVTRDNQHASSRQISDAELYSIFNASENLIEASHRLDEMANTQELDRLLEELRLTSINMNSGSLGGGASISNNPPRSAPYSSSSYSSSQHQHTTRRENLVNESRYHQSTRLTSSSSTSGNRFDHHHQPPPIRYPTNTSSTCVRPRGGGDHGSSSLSSASSYYTDRRLEDKSHASYLSPLSPSNRSAVNNSNNSQHHTTYTTTLKHSTPQLPRHCSQVHLTIDPECGKAESISVTPLHGTTGRTQPSSNRREEQLEVELRSARQELAQLKRAMSLVEERQQRHDSQLHVPSRLSPGYLPPLSPTSSLHTGPQHYHSSASSTMYQTNQQSTRSTYVIYDFAS